MLNEEKIFSFFKKDREVAVAFSGGTDSCCLSYILKKKLKNFLLFLLTLFFILQTILILRLPMQITLKFH